MVEVAATVWQTPDGRSEYTSITPADIVDPSGNYLVDPSGNQIISTATERTTIEDTVWTESPGE